MSFDSMLNSTCNIMQETRTSDGMSGFEKAYTPARESNVPCRIRAATGQERQMSGNMGVSITHRIFMRETTVFSNDRILLNGTLYQVRFVNHWDEAGHHLQIDVLELRRDGT